MPGLKKSSKWIKRKYEEKHSQKEPVVACSVQESTNNCGSNMLFS
jgi:hypothetical protein